MTRDRSFTGLSDESKLIPVLGYLLTVACRHGGGVEQPAQTRGRFPNGIWHTDVFPAAHWLTRLPFEGLALSA
jgi:hypothetical protein